MRSLRPTTALTGLLCLLLAACGSMEVHTRPDSGFTRESPVSISLHEDKVGLGARLTSRLVGKGFRVVDEASLRRTAVREREAEDARHAARERSWHVGRAGSGQDVGRRHEGEAYRAIPRGRRDGHAYGADAYGDAYGAALYRTAGRDGSPMYRGASRFEDSPRRTAASLAPRHVMDVAYEVRSKSRMFREPKHTVTSLSARITDLETGEIVLSAAFGGKRSVDDAVDLLIERIEKRLD